MAELVPQRSVFREPAAYAGVLCVGYVLAGIGWMGVQESRGRMDPDVDAGVMSLFVLATTVIVFPCAFIVASAGSFLWSTQEWNRPWRPFVAGVLAASVLWSGPGENLFRWCDSWETLLPLPPPLVGLVSAITPFQAVVFGGSVVGWLIPPWSRPGVPQGGSGKDILPPGAS